MDFSSVLQVPNTKDAVLQKNLIKEESKLARISGYNVRIVESSGVQLIRLFPRTFKRASCHWTNCEVCMQRGDKPSRCRTNNLVYEGSCLECKGEVEDGARLPEDAGVYVGESSRTLAERVREHVNGAKNLEYDNFITKHWALQHSDLKEPPKIKFVPIKSYKDALTRLVSESVWIEAKANMNSKGEWRTNKVSRLKIDKST